MRLVYVDTSTLLKRVVAEPGAEATRDRLAALAQSDQLVTSSLAFVEVARALRRLAARTGGPVRVEAIAVATSGVAERPIDADVVALARRVAPDGLRTLDALHLATAVLVDVDLLLTHDERLAEAARQLALDVESP